MNREKRKVNPKYVSVVMEELAFKMFTENKNVITIDEIYETVDRKFRADIMKGRVDIDDINKKIRTASFIYRDSEDNFVFMHRSFMEFFIAKKLSQSSAEAEATSADTTSTAQSIKRKGIFCMATPLQKSKKFG